MTMTQSERENVLFLMESTRNKLSGMHETLNKLVTYANGLPKNRSLKECLLHVGEAIVSMDETLGSMGDKH